MTDYGIDLEGGEHAVLLIHGMTGSPFEMKPLARRLHRAGFTVKGPCLAGHGGTIKELTATTWRDWYGTAHENYTELKKTHKNVSVAGLCAGALLALYLAYEEKEASSIALMSTTFFYDGWSLPWYRFLLPFMYYPPFRYFYKYEEREPYGIKDERMRKHVAMGLKDGSIAHDSFPADCLRELFKLIRASRKILPLVSAPTLILHAEEDDLASVKNAELVEKSVASKNVKKIIVKDSYHMLTLDKQKDFVADEIIKFFRENASSRASGLKNSAGIIKDYKGVL